MNPVSHNGRSQCYRQISRVLPMHTHIDSLHSVAQTFPSNSCPHCCRFCSSRMADVGVSRGHGVHLVSSHALLFPVDDLIQSVLSFLHCGCFWHTIHVRHPVFRFYIRWRLCSSLYSGCCLCVGSCVNAVICAVETVVCPGMERFGNFTFSTFVPDVFQIHYSTSNSADLPYHTV